MRFIISIIESIYIIYMFNYFKTSIYLSHPFDIFTRKIKFIDHSEKENHICPMGNYFGFLLPIWLSADLPIIEIHFQKNYRLARNTWTNR